MNKKNPDHYIFDEIVIVLLSGGVPISLIAFFHGYEQIITYLNCINTAAEIIVYLFAFLAFSAALAAYEKLAPWLGLDVTKFFIKTRKIAHQIGASLHGTYRTISGAALIAPIPILCVSPSSQSLGWVSISLLFGAVGLLVCTILTFFNEVLEPPKQ